MVISTDEANEIARLDAHGQAALVRDGEIAPSAPVEAAILRILALDPAINAVCAHAFDQARAAVVDRSAKMPGIPYLLKASLEYPGFPVRCGSRARSDEIATRAFPLARRLDEAGLLPVGMSTMPEFGLNATGEAILYGPTRNPWDLTRSSGGSSSGAGAAVAAGLVPFATGSDAGGSIRIPASNCGIIGFKPSRGWNLRARAYNLIDDILCSDGLYGRSMRDTAWAARFLRPANRTTRRDPHRRLRIVVDPVGLSGRAADAELVAVIDRAAVLCAELGHNVEHGTLTIDRAALRAGFMLLWAYLGGEIVDLYGAERLEPFTLGLAEKRTGVDPETLATCLAQIDRASRALAGFYETADIVLSPVTATVPPPLGHLAPTRAFDELFAALFDYVDYTPLQNMTGTPAISLPLFAGASSLPVGAMFAAAHGDDETLLALGAELEAARPWADRWPPMAF